MNPICEACAGGCCSFKSMNISLTLVDKGERWQKRIHPAQLRRPSGKPLRMRFYLAWRSKRRGNKNHKEQHILFDCQHRSSTGKCRIYADRPALCRMYRCEALRGLMSLRELFQQHGKLIQWRRLRNITRQVRCLIAKEAP